MMELMMTLFSLLLDQMLEFKLETLSVLEKNLDKLEIRKMLMMVMRIPFLLTIKCHNSKNLIGELKLVSQEVKVLSLSIKRMLKQRMLMITILIQSHLTMICTNTNQVILV